MSNRDSLRTHLHMSLKLSQSLAFQNAVYKKKKKAKHNNKKLNCYLLSLMTIYCSRLSWFPTCGQWTSFWKTTTCSGLNIKCLLYDHRFEHLVPQLMALFGKVIGPLQGRTLLGEDHHCRQALRFHRLAPLLPHCLCFLCVDSWRPCWSHTSTAMPSSPWGTVSPRTVSQNNPVFFHLL